MASDGLRNCFWRGEGRAVWECEEEKKGEKEMTKFCAFSEELFNFAPWCGLRNPMRTKNTDMPRYSILI